ncbi:MAG: radical SAM protein, partial [Candidatus Ranarchaeia archaeon]
MDTIRFRDEQKIRVSIGTAAVLGLKRMTQRDPPTTAYLLLDAPEGCLGGCLFCPQSRFAQVTDQRMLSRILWPIFLVTAVVDALRSHHSSFRRICVQAVNTSSSYSDLLFTIRSLKQVTDTPISLSIQPFSIEQLRVFHGLGVDRVGIPLDASTPSLFKKIKGSNGCYTWEHHWQGLRNAVNIFGPHHVSTHLIIGLGETEEDAINVMTQLIEEQITVGLFAFTPISGTPLEKMSQPDIATYRKIQLARFLLMHSISNESLSLYKTQL